MTRGLVLLSPFAPHSTWRMQCRASSKCHAFAARNFGADEKDDTSALPWAGGEGKSANKFEFREKCGYDILC